VKATFTVGPERMHLREDHPEPIVERDETEPGSAGRVLRPSDVESARRAPQVVALGRVHALARAGAHKVRVVAGGAELGAEVEPDRFADAVLLRTSVDAILLDEVIVIEGLSPQNRYLATRLPALRPLAEASSAGSTRGIRLSPRILLLDLERMLATVTWAGVLERPDDAFSGRVVETNTTERSQTVEIEMGPSAFPSDASREQLSRGLPFPAGHQPLPPPVESRRAPQRPPPAARNPPSGAPPRLPTYLQHRADDVAAPPPPSPPSDVLREAARTGATAASDAAAAVQEPQVSLAAQADTAATDTPEVPVRLSWHATDKLPTVCAWRPWRSLAEPEPPTPEPKPPKRGEPPPPPPPAPDASVEAEKRKKHLVAILQRAAPATLVRSYGRQPTKDGSPPLVLIDAVIAPSFDEVEELKLTTELASQLTPSDNKKARDAIDYAMEVQKLPVSGTPEFARQLTLHVRDATANSNRSLPPKFLVRNVERQLLEKRLYVKRSVFGSEHVRAGLELDDGPAPLYLPAQAVEQLPMLVSFRARMIAEVHPPQDDLEASPIALLLVAWGRVSLPTPGPIEKGSA